MGYSIREEVLGMDIYKAGKPISEVKRELQLKKVIKLASNENPLGCSPKVKEVLSDLVEHTNLYPDASNHELKGEISKKFNVDMDEVFCGTGSDSLIKVICNTLLNPGDECIMGEVTFSRYMHSTQLMGGKSVIIPMKDNALDIEKMVDSITDKTKIIWFCNPNNPTGTIFTKDQFEKVIDKIPSNVVIIMDEAYIEYVTSKDFPDSLELRKKYPNIVILRTFSKAYGLAGLRCGFGIGDKELVKYFNTVIGPFDVNLFAQRAATAALKDTEFIDEVRKVNIEGKKYICKEFEAMGLKYVPTETNFIMVNIEREDKEVFDSLLRKGVIIRPGSLLGMPKWLRVTIGSMEQNKVFIEELKNCLK